MFTLEHSKDVLLPIPNNSNTGIKDIIEVKANGKVTSLKVTVDIKHGNSGDLKVTLFAPSGKSVVLQNRQGGPRAFMKTTFQSNVLAPFANESIKGKWTLQVNDLAAGDKGMLNKWSMEMNASHAEQSIGEVMVEIPDNKSKGLVSQCAFEDEGILAGLEVSVDIAHAYIGDLSATLIAPSGKKAMLHNRGGGALKQLKKTFKNEETSVFVGEKIKGIWKLQIQDHDARDTGILNAWGLSMRVGTAKDDLTKVEGIGPKIAELLAADGINTFVDLSASSQQKLKACLEKGGPRFKMHNTETWAQQASLAALGEWEELKVWQDELDGGRAN